MYIPTAVRSFELELVGTDLSVDALHELVSIRRTAYVRLTVVVDNVTIPRICVLRMTACYCSPICAVITTGGGVPVPAGQVEECRIDQNCYT
jgi:hypothetical protein